MNPTGSPLGRWGVLMARHRRPVLVAWLLLLIGAGALNPVLQSKLGVPDYSVQGSGSARAQAALQQHFPELGAEQDMIVFRAPSGVDDPAVKSTVDKVVASAERRSDITTVLSPYDVPEQISADRTVALAVFGMKGTEAERGRTAADLQRKVGDEVRDSPVEAYLTGSSPLNNDLAAVELADQEKAEIIGVPIALLVLLLALGAVVAAVVPIAVAFASVILCMGILALLATPLRMDQFVSVITTVIGIGIGIDYALFVLSRFREELAKRTNTYDAVAVAMRTSGRMVVTSGLIMIVALGSMTVLDGHIFFEIAVAAILVVMCCLLASLTLLPALLAALGNRVNKGTLPRWLLGRNDQGARWRSWGRFVLRHRVKLVIPGLLILVGLAWPISSIQLGMDLGLKSLGDTPSGKGHQIASTAFNPGSTAPVQVLACAPEKLDDRSLDGVARLTSSLRSDGRVSQVTSVTDVLDAQLGGHTAALLSQARSAPDSGGVLGRLATDRCAYVHVVLSKPVDSLDAGNLVRELRDELVSRAFTGVQMDVLVGGLTAQYVDLSEETTTGLPLVIGIVLLLSFGYLMIVFRSLLLPAKAVLLNLMATAATLGVLVFVFQQGHGDSLLGFTSVGTLQAFLPVALFVLLFGLSMDYEVFLVSRIQEEYQRSGDNDEAVAEALGHTARQITAGAAIMIAVFGALVAADVLELKQFGFGLAFAVLLDATLVRMLLVPAAMGIARRANWWLPQWLEKILPNVKAH